MVATPLSASSQRVQQAVALQNQTMRERKSHQLVLHRKEPHGTLSCITTASKHLQRNRYTTYKFCLRHTSQRLICPTFFVLGQKFFLRTIVLK